MNFSIVVNITKIKKSFLDRTRFVLIHVPNRQKSNFLVKSPNNNNFSLIIFFCFLIPTQINNYHIKSFNIDITKKKKKKHSIEIISQITKEGSFHSIKTSLKQHFSHCNSITVTNTVIL